MFNHLSDAHASQGCPHRSDNPIELAKLRWVFVDRSSVEDLPKSIEGSDVIAEVVAKFTVSLIEDALWLQKIHRIVP
uniref:Uncharacterized protein n=1 Tax=Candidatus Kentrum sp. LFY TaxID=2126342 RepID=A0A450U945_9GAMM|nr:MAG: hypothetical protein BECKLFY1418A_GA0070994_100454 [Candidatus Kentron sp. LFY]